MRHYMTGCGERRVGFKNQVHECIRWLGLGTGVRVVGVGTVRSDISMRIVCWNVNGLRTLKSYAPWYGLPSWEACLKELHADIACFQEVKMTRKQLTYAMCVMDDYEAFYDLHPTKGYSGTAVFVRKRVCRPCKAQVGITGLGQGDQIGLPAVLTQSATNPVTYAALDQEGRCIVLDCGLFVLINVYAPNETDAERVTYKMAFYHALEERVRSLINEGRHVIVVGDMNVVASPRDHCESAKVPAAEFSAHPARQWFQAILAPQGPLMDMARHFFPERDRMYTCWNTLIDARASNYGTRLDYTLVTQGLEPWIQHADIQPQVHGSDHCPIYLDLRDSVETSTGRTYLVDLLHGEKDGMAAPHPLPRLATSRWDAYSTKTQPRLADMFGAQRQRQAELITPQAGQQEHKLNQVTTCTPETILKSELPHEPAHGAAFHPASLAQSVGAKTCAASGTRSSKRVKKNHAQATLTSFVTKHVSDPPVTRPSKTLLSTTTNNTKRQDTAAQWSSLFTPHPAPMCTTHREPAKSFLVTKPGINHGRKFWLCSRPVGPGYDQRTRSQTPYRCNYFAWDSDIKRKHREKEKQQQQQQQPSNSRNDPDMPT